MWTPKGWAKSVHISEPYRVVDTLLSTAKLGDNNQQSAYSIKEECPHRRSVHKGGTLLYRPDNDNNY